MSRQRTLAKDVSVAGVGLHTGAKVTLRALPAPAGAGIAFVRTDLPQAPVIPASAEYAVESPESLGMRRTTLVKDGAEVQTVEHLMAALWGMGIDNARLEVSGSELPGLDGSADGFVQLLKRAGSVEQDAPRRMVSLRAPVLVEDGPSSIAVYPADDLKVSYMLSYDHPFLKSQFVDFREPGSGNGQAFESAIAPARTFVLRAEAEALQARGLGRGASFENTLVVDDTGVMQNTLRFPDECARHKVLDLIGDLYLVGRLQARVIAIKSGHRLNVRAIHAIAKACDRAEAGGATCAGGESFEAPLDIIQIMRILPHRHPFLLVDRILSLTETKAVGVKCVTVNEDFFRGHFPGRPVMPGVLMVEAMAQVAGVLVLSKPEARGKLFYFMSIDKVKFRKPVVPGDQLVLEAEVGKMRSRTAMLTGRALVDGKVVCEGELMFAVVD